ncbi:hypothetical protein BKA70DRAFT_1566309 [Coprinopsis sp. MPI-PUGE-AT-0042]|nr:hypothetical protein BKA70DRAFT_1566309 [Coprinopsis sp. MPI-PUGE-AT-0042]
MHSTVNSNGRALQAPDFQSNRSWDTELAPLPSECSPTAITPHSMFSGLQSAQIHGGTFTVVGRDNITTVNNSYYAPRAVTTDIWDVLDSLSLPNFRDIQLDTHAKATEGTCVWFTRGWMFLLWIAKGKILWGIGIPGAGKTILASIVIHDLQQREEASGGHICVAYVYLRYSEPLTVRDILESLVKQIVERHIDLLPIIEGLYAKHKRERTKPSQQDLMGVLASFVGRGKMLFFILDALDEMRAEDRPTLVRLLASFKARLFITSRPLETLQQQFSEAQVFKIAATPSDIDLHIKDFLQHSPDVMALLEGTDFEDRIVETVHRKSGGMFLHVKLQLEALCQCTSALDVEETLENFPTEIEDIYMRTWERILAQGPKQSNLAKLVLLWITHAHSEMTIDTLRRAVATSPDSHVFEAKRMAPEALLLSACCGLVSIDEKTRLVRLIHYTTRDAILPRILELYPIPHATLAHVCIAQITASGFQIYNLEAGILARTGFKTPPRDDTLRSYAHQSWGYHTRQCDCYTPIMIAATELVLNCTEFPLRTESWVDFGGPLHVAAFYGLEELILPAAQLQSPNARTTIDERSPLMLALRYGHLACAKALLSLPGIDVNLVDRFSRDALSRAAFYGHLECVQLLAKAPDIDINAVDDDGWTSLICAVLNGHTDIVKLLLALPGIATNVADKQGWTALIHATRTGHIDTVKLLLGLPGIDINSRDVKGWTALKHAVCWGHTDVENQLLGAPGIDVDLVSGPGQATLSLKSAETQSRIAELLLTPSNKRRCCGRLDIYLPC